MIQTMVIFRNRQNEVDTTIYNSVATAKKRLKGRKIYETKDFKAFKNVSVFVKGWMLNYSFPRYSRTIAFIITDDLTFEIPYGWDKNKGE